MLGPSLLLTKRQLLLQAAPFALLRHNNDYPRQIRVSYPTSRTDSTTCCSSGMGKASTALSRRLHAYVSGNVQGVFFRSYTKSKATELGLTGWVRNRRDGRVEVVAEGYESDLQQLLTWLHSGPPQADVSGVDATWGAATGEFDDFDTSWTA